MDRRQAIILGTVGLPLTIQAAFAGKSINSGLLLCRAALDKSTIPFDGEFSIVCSLEARLHFCRVYAPLAWGYLTGFRLRVESADGKVSEPKFHPPTDVPPPAMVTSGAHFRELDVGESVSFRTKLKAKDVFPSPGNYKLRVTYVPEPPGKFTTVGQAVTMEDGPVEAAPLTVKVV